MVSGTYLYHFGATLKDTYLVLGNKGRDKWSRIGFCSVVFVLLFLGFSATNLFPVKSSIRHLLHHLHDPDCMTVSAKSRRLDAGIIIITNTFYDVRPSTN